MAGQNWNNYRQELPCGCVEVRDLGTLARELISLRLCPKHWAESIANNIDPKLLEAVRRQCGPEKPFTLGSL